MLRRTRGDRHEHSLSNPIVHVAPPYAVAPEGQQPDDERRGIPNDDKRHLFPKSSLMQSPNTDEPGHRYAKPRIGAKIDENDSCRRTTGRTGKSPWKALC